MPRPKPKSTPQKTTPAQLEVVHPLWLLKALAVTFAAALVCGYITLCILFYQGQWQFILHPLRNTIPLTEIGPVAAQPVHFDAGPNAQPRLSGAYIPAAANAPYASLIALYLRGGDQSLAQSPTDQANLALLHAIGLNVLAFDYRGYGLSDPLHPNHTRMTEDASAALHYLEDIRFQPEDHILLYGTGLGASLATTLAAQHPKLAALILDQPLDEPGPTPLALALADPRARPLPVRLLFREDFPLTALHTLSIPKLLISYPTPANPAIPASYRTAADPKTTLELKPGDPAPLATAIPRFLDQNALPSPRR
jgi:pimeloyl-ACP methyl ester carboxylesterase